MSSASFSINVEPTRDLIRIRMSGFFSADDISRFRAELQSAHLRLGRGHRDGPLTINDITGMDIQSQDVVKSCGAFLANPAHRSRRLAFVVASTLARMQLQRALGDRQANVFTNQIEAEQWLFGLNSCVY